MYRLLKRSLKAITPDTAPSPPDPPDPPDPPETSNVVKLPFSQRAYAPSPAQQHTEFIDIDPLWGKSEFSSNLQFAGLTDASWFQANGGNVPDDITYWEIGRNDAGRRANNSSYIKIKMGIPWNDGAGNAYWGLPGVFDGANPTGTGTLISSSDQGPYRHHVNQRYFLNNVPQPEGGTDHGIKLQDGTGFREYYGAHLDEFAPEGTFKYHFWSIKPQDNGTNYDWPGIAAGNADDPHYMFNTTQTGNKFGGFVSWQMVWSGRYYRCVLREFDGGPVVYYDLISPSTPGTGGLGMEFFKDKWIDVMVRFRVGRTSEAGTLGYQPGYDIWLRFPTIDNVWFNALSVDKNCIEGVGDPTWETTYGIDPNSKSMLDFGLYPSGRLSGSYEQPLWTAWHDPNTTKYIGMEFGESSVIYYGDYQNDPGFATVAAAVDAAYDFVDFLGAPPSGTLATPVVTNWEDYNAIDIQFEVDTTYASGSTGRELVVQFVDTTGAGDTITHEQVITSMSEGSSTVGFALPITSPRIFYDRVDIFSRDSSGSSDPWSHETGSMYMNFNPNGEYSMPASVSNTGNTIASTDVDGQHGRLQGLQKLVNFHGGEYDTFPTGGPNNDRYVQCRLNAAAQLGKQRAEFRFDGHESDWNSLTNIEGYIPINRDDSVASLTFKNWRMLNNGYWKAPRNGQAFWMMFAARDPNGSTSVSNEVVWQFEKNIDETGLEAPPTVFGNRGGRFGNSRMASCIIHNTEFDITASDSDPAAGVDRGRSSTFHDLGPLADWDNPSTSSWRWYLIWFYPKGDATGMLKIWIGNGDGGPVTFTKVLDYTGSNLYNVNTSSGFYFHQHIGPKIGIYDAQYLSWGGEPSKAIDYSKWMILYDKPDGSIYSNANQWTELSFFEAKALEPAV